MSSWIQSLCILLGGVVLSFCWYRSLSLRKAVPLLPEFQRGPLSRRIRAQRLLIAFFSIAYFLVAVLAWAISLEVSFRLVVTILVGGAAFVLIGVDIQLRLVLGTAQTLHGIIPICGHCKRVRQDCTDKEILTGLNDMIWTEIENFLLTRSEARFSHTICPTCLGQHHPEIAELMAQKSREAISVASA